MASKNIGKVFALYPTPDAIIGTVVDGRVNWNNIAHLGIVGMDKIMLSMHKSHFTNKGIIKNKTASVNLFRKDLIKKADYVGITSGKNTDKSKVFKYYNGELDNAPLIEGTPISMECKLVDIYETENEDNFILQVVNTYVDEEILDDNGKIDYEKAKIVLFEMPNKSYIESGAKVGNCYKDGKELL